MLYIINMMCIQYLGILNTSVIVTLYMNVKDRHTKLTHPNVSACYVLIKIAKNHIIYLVFRHMNRGTFSSFECGILLSIVHYINSVVMMA